MSSALPRELLTASVKLDFFEMKLVLVPMLTNVLLKKRIVMLRLSVKTQTEVTNAVVTRATTETVKCA